MRNVSCWTDGAPVTAGKRCGKLSQQPPLLLSLWTEVSANEDGLRDQSGCLQGRINSALVIVSVQGPLSATGSSVASFSLSVPSLHNDTNPVYLLTDMSFKVG